MAFTSRAILENFNFDMGTYIIKSIKQRVWDFLEILTQIEGITIESKKLEKIVNLESAYT